MAPLAPAPPAWREQARDSVRSVNKSLRHSPNPVVSWYPPDDARAGAQARVSTEDSRSIRDRHRSTRWPSAPSRASPSDSQNSWNRGNRNSGKNNDCVLLRSDPERAKSIHPGSSAGHRRRSDRVHSYGDEHELGGRIRHSRTHPRLRILWTDPGCSPKNDSS